MKKTLTTIALLLAFVTAQAQTLSVQVGNVTDQYPAEQAGEMTYTGGTALTILGKTYNLSEITSMGTTQASMAGANTVNVVYSGTSAQVYVGYNVVPYVTATVSGAHVSISQSNTDAVDDDEITYVLSGTTTDGEFALDGSYKCTVSLAGLTMTNPSGAAINITNKKRIQISAKSGTENTLKDGTANTAKGCIYSKGQIQLQGKGTLNVYAYGPSAHAIKSGDYIQVKNLTLNVKAATKDGINANKYFLMQSGTVTISGVGDDGIQADLESDDTATGETTDHEDENSGNAYLQGGTLDITVTAEAAKGVNSTGDIKVADGTIGVTTSGGGVWDSDDKKTKASACLGADGNISIDGGTLTLTSKGAGGKGISADGSMTMTAGTVTVNTSGNAVVASSSGSLSVVSNSKTLDNYTTDYKSSPKGIKIDSGISISGGTVSIVTTGAGGEGLESKGTLTISGGNISITASDDAINSSGDMTISGGTVGVSSTGNDALDANGNMYLKGGNIVAIGASGAETGIDINENKALYITGGNIFGMGGRIDAKLGSASQGIITTSGSVTKNATVTVTAQNSSTALATFTMPASYSNGRIMISCTGMTSGTTYTVQLGTSSTSAKASNTLSSNNSGGGPGGRW